VRDAAKTRAVPPDRRARTRIRTSSVAMRHGCCAHGGGLNPMVCGLLRRVFFVFEMGDRAGGCGLVCVRGVRAG
jgi:hypothetical protein